MKQKVLGLGIIAIGAFAPVIPQEMELLYSYQTTYEAQFAEIPPEFSETFNPPDFDDTNGDGLISASVFADRKGNQVYTQIDETKYRDMGKRGGIKNNPSKAEFLSAIEMATPKVEAAIAFSSATNPTYVNAISHTFAHTISGSDPLLWVQTWRRNGTAVSTVTYNGTGMTATQSEVNVASDSGAQYMQLWYLAAPSSGSNNVVVTSSIATEHIDSAVSYTGASQTGIPDAISSQSQNTQTNTTGTVVTVADNSWAIMTVRNAGATSATAGAGTTRRAVGASQFTTTFDGNGAKTPAGSYSLIANHASAQAGYVMASFAPAGGAPPPRRIINAN